MKYYLENNNTLNCIAVINENGIRNLCYDAIVAMNGTHDSPVCGSSVSIQYLKKCQEITLDNVKSYHPALFQFLENNKK